VTGINYGSGSDDDFVTIKYVQTQAVAEAGSTGKKARIIEIYPNPFQNSCRIKVNAKCAVFNSIGQRVTDLEKGESIWRPSYEMKAGVYFIRAMNDRNSVTVRVIYLK